MSAAAEACNPIYQNTHLSRAPRSPWQTAYVERLIGSARRECRRPRRWLDGKRVGQPTSAETTPRLFGSGFRSCEGGAELLCVSSRLLAWVGGEDGGSPNQESAASTAGPRSASPSPIRQSRAAGG